jgi:archaellum biogenesis ATPase FlaH
MADTAFDPITYLASKGYQGRQANGPEVVYPCFFDCGLPADSRKRKLYVHSEEGYFDCKVCGASGGTYLLQKHFGDEPTKVQPGEDPHTRRRILNWAADVGTAMLKNNDDVMLYLTNKRGLFPDTIVDRKIGWVGANWSLTGSLPETFSRDELSKTGLVYRDGPRAGQDFYYDHILIPYLSRGNVVQIRGKVQTGKYLTGPGDPARLFDQDALEGAEDVIITEGEFDAMALAQHLHTAADDRARRFAVVGLPGAGVFKEDFPRYFTNAKRVYIGLDPDATGKREAVKIKEALGTRARILELPSELPKCDWTDYLLPVPADAPLEWRNAHPHAGHSWRDVMQLLGTAAGKRVFSIRDAGSSYRAAREQGEGLKTGFTTLDATIAPGLREGQVLVFLAKTGGGKTIMLCNLAFNMRRKRVLFISLEQTREEVYERMRRIALFHNPRFTDEELEADLENVFISDENKLGDKDVAQLIEEATVEAGGKPDVVIVDYLQYFARGANGNSQYERVTNAVMALKEIAKKNRLVIISPSQVNRLAKEGQPIDIDDARDSGAIEETADFLLSLWRPDEGTEAMGNENVPPSGKVRIGTLKSRHGGKGKVFSLVMDLLTLAIVDEHGAAARTVRDHNHLLWRGTTYAQLRTHETKPTQLPMDSEGHGYGQ